jgi:hypothetical protein
VLRARKMAIALFGASVLLEALTVRRELLLLTRYQTELAVGATLLSPSVIAALLWLPWPWPRAVQRSVVVAAIVLGATCIHALYLREHVMGTFSDMSAIGNIEIVLVRYGVVAVASIIAFTYRRNNWELH